jgi:toxin ParE1/3/4
MRFRLSHQALSDLQEIRAFTVEHWGRAQWNTYFAGLSDSFERIALNQNLGRSRDLIRQGMRSLPYQRHLIFFQTAAGPDGRVAILRILHERRNFAALSYHDDLDG